MSKLFPWSEKEAYAKSLDVASLHYAIRDCEQAEAAMRGWNPEKEGWYADERSVYAAELRRRQGKK